MVSEKKIQAAVFICKDTESYGICADNMARAELCSNDVPRHNVTVGELDR